MTFRIKTATKHVPLNEAEILSRMERFWLAAEENRRGVVVALLILLVAIGIVAGAIWYDSVKEQEALSVYEEANRFASIQPEDKPEQSAKNMDQAVLQYQKVIKEYPRSSIAPLSQYQLGLLLEKKNDQAGAIEVFQKFMTQHPDRESMVGLVAQRLGYIYLQQGEREKAEKSFTKVLSIPGALNKDHVLFELGKLEEDQSRPEGALARYQELQEQFPNSPLTSETAVRIKALGGKDKASEDSTNQGKEAPTSSPKEPDNAETSKESAEEGAENGQKKE